MRRGAGGVTRSSHQMTGNPANASSSQGEAKASEPNANTAQPGALITAIVSIRCKVLAPPIAGQRSIEC